MSVPMGWSLTLLNYGDEWCAHRRLAVNGFGNQVIKVNPTFTRNVYGLLRRLLESPDAWQEHVRHHVGAMIIEITYGLDVIPQNDPFIESADKAATTISAAAMPVAFLVNTVPILKHGPSWFIGAGFERKAKEWTRYAGETLEVPFKALKEEIRCLQDLDPNIDTAYQERVIKGAAAIMYVAGGDTSVSFLGTLVLAMIQYHTVQRRAQAELDSVLGPDRLATFEDMPALPYLSAIIKECHSCEVVLPFAAPHMLTADDDY
ncbi:cytochrome P450 [Athelia psychrophila]|uniref:Cytochrome P450 n=1 Tax=Athelia psychrophila TaxID=1759441 RepID=A0A166F018_9AGAM|nr:cytochrome P450 [Fibularhizoctonia sp. CBS 109695]